MREAVICEPVRTPIGSYGGMFKSLTAVDLGVAALKGLLDRTAIAPGLIRSAMTEAMPQHIWDQKVAEVPMGRAGEPAEVASVALFLASDLSSYMTGTVMEVTGGRFM